MNWYWFGLAIVVVVGGWLVDASSSSMIIVVVEVMGRLAMVVVAGLI